MNGSKEPTGGIVRAYSLYIVSSLSKGNLGLLAMSWTGLAATSAAIARSGAGGIGAAIPRRPVAKIALALRTAVGCRRPHWVFIEGAPGKARCV
jgi:hypothetical protein